MRGIAAHIDKLVILACSLCLLSQTLLAQQTSRDNYSGAWSAPGSWVPDWPAPLTVISGFDINIYGYITSDGSLSFSGSAAILTVHDTLIVKGDLLMSNNSQLIIENGGILIVRGNLTMENQGRISANSYLIVTGNFVKAGSIGQGSFTSDDNPVSVFLGGSANPVSLYDNVNYPVLNCATPPTTPYTNSGCSYGNLSDLANDQIYSFFVTTCGTAVAGSNSPVCEGNDLKMTASDGGSAYLWSGPNGFSSDLQNPVISLSSRLNEGKYSVTVTFSDGCRASASTNISLIPAPSMVVTNPGPLCIPLTVNLTDPSVTAGSSAELAFSYWSDPDATVACAKPEAAVSGTYYIKGTAISGCYNIKPVIVTVNQLPPVTITSSSNSLCLNDTKRLTGYPEGGSFAVSSGPGIISGNVLSATGPGDIMISYTYSGLCAKTVFQTVHFFDMPVSSPGPDQLLRDVFETQMHARLALNETGEWSLVSGSGLISDIHSPTTTVSGLEVGENIFRWKVVLGNCETFEEVKINVLELFIPSVITPNGDGKNDFFTVWSLNGRTELIIFNRWGVAEYSNNDYQNDWDGHSGKGSELPADTYMYILKFESGLVKKGTVLIKR